MRGLLSGLFALFASLAFGQDALFNAYLQAPDVSFACVTEQNRKGLDRGINTCVVVVHPPLGTVDVDRVEFEAYVNYSYFLGREPDWSYEEGVDGPIQASAPIQYGERWVEVLRIIRPHQETLIPLLQRTIDWGKANSLTDATSSAVYTGLPVSISDTARSVLFTKLLRAQRNRAYPGGSLSVTLRIRVCGLSYCSRTATVRF